MLAEAAALLRGARRPLIVSGGGTIYGEATDALRELAEATGIGVGETQAGKGSLPYDHPQALGAIGATGTTAANAAAREADVILGVGTRWSDFTTASRSLFAGDATFINLNVASVDAFKHAGPAARRRCAARAGGAQRGAGRDVRDAGERLGRRRRTRVQRAPRPARAGRGDRRRQPRQRAAGRRGVRRRLDAGRPAQAVAHARPEGLPRRVRLLDDGLRDRRRPRHQAGRARPRGVRHGRRRLVPDDGPGDRDRGGRGHQAHDRPRPEPRLPVDRRARANPSAPSASARPTATAAPTRSCRSTSRPTRPRSAPARSTRTRSTSSRPRCARPSRATSPPSCWSTPTRRSTPRTPRRGGTCRWRRSPRSTPPARRERSTSATRPPSRRILRPRERGALEVEVGDHAL